ncbi:hypothetical protein E1286_19675 [Nonomuraea terrae]|uniref:Uncharacterized protein n=1 Tax=Nonomuraea terrae TaxID=2530383 RepID=A0A4R4YNY9_9ACTN|nr:hypothetical protein [Nonomuraea terrae]TDD46848.1 hypothetical protein E1286_19675 [Nonomuraea terrae]
MAQPGDRRGVAFAAIAVVLAAVGLYLTLWSDPPEPEPAEPEARATSAAVASSTPLATASDEPFDVYAYLPMTEEQLAAAADLAERFTAEYGTFRYDEDAAAYAARLKAYTTAELGNTLARTRTSAGTVEEERDDQLVSTATARLKEIRQVERSSIVFVVTATRQIDSNSSDQAVTEDYAVTVSQLGSDWRIYDILPATEGQEGDTSG